ncbi:MAG: hypothetical protein EOO08_05565 [Chitinophagaceae bacterium]|nr:MAG: hypothetical protein EOO08_05565 [Chitinophagaceae bacterium]
MNDTDTGLLVGVLIFAGIFFLIWLVVMILFLLSQQNTLKAIQPHNRKMTPGEVWLQLIPLFGSVWAFIVVNRIADSLHLELNTSQFSFENGGYSEAPTLYNQKEKPTRSIGMAYCICAVCAWIPIIGSFIGFGALVCWIIYWVELNKQRKLIEQRRFAEQFNTVQPFNEPSSL